MMTGAKVAASMVETFKNMARVLEAGHSAEGTVEWLHLAIDGAAQLQEVLAEAASRNAYVIRGNPHRYEEKLYNQLGSRRKDSAGSTVLFLNISALKTVTEHVRQDQVISVESGITIGELDEILCNHQQWLPVSFFDKNLSIADLIDSGDAGTTEAMTGGMRSLVLGMNVALAGGKSIKTGGKIVKNVTGYDLSKMFIGARGWFGIPHAVHLRLFARPTLFETFVVASQDAAELLHLANTLVATGLPLSSLELVDFGLLVRTRDLLKERQQESDSIAETLKSVSDFVDKAIGSEVESAPLLVVSSHGHGEAAKETCQALKHHVEKLKLPMIDLEDANGKILCQLLSDLPSIAGANSFELALPPSTMAYFMETWWPEHGRPMWSARPTAGRLRLALAADAPYEIAQDWAASLCRFSELIGRSSWQSLTVSYPTEQLDCLVEEMRGKGTSGGADILTQNLKLKFDPTGIFNPLVEFRTARSEAVVPI